MNFADRLEEAVRRAGNPCLLGLDPHLDLLPEAFAAARDPGSARAKRAEAVGDFCCELVELAAGRVPAVKPQSAFFEIFGADGARQWERVVRAARQAGLLVIGDVKRGDISSTATAYAQAFLEGPPGSGAEERAALCDAITVNPFLGRDSLEPFVAAAKRSGGGLYALVRTSNPGSHEIQLHGEPALFLRLAELVEDLGAPLRGACGLSSLGAVVGATHPEDLALLRRRMPHTPFLLPGYGAQGAGVSEIRAGFLPGGRGALVNSSRGVAFAWKSGPFAGRPWKDAARLALEAMTAELALAAR